MPHLNSLLYLVMPLPLNMFDDYQDSNILTALDAFQHIIDNTVSISFGLNTNMSNTILPLIYDFK